MVLQQLIDSLINGDAAAREAAARSLASMGRDAAPAAAALVLNAGEEGAGEWCVAALEELGPPRQEDLGDIAELLDYGVEDSVYWAATLLGRAGPSAVEAVDKLAATAGGDPEALRESPEQPSAERAVWALGKIGPAASRALPLLHGLADSGPARLARLARQAIEAIGG